MGWPMSPPPGSRRLRPLRLELRRQREDTQEDRWRRLECRPGTWMSLTLTYQGPCSLRLSDSLIQEAWPVSQTWSGCSDLENTLPNPPQSCGKKPYAVLRLRIKKFFFSFGKGSSSHFEPSPSSSPRQLPTMYFQPILESRVAFRRCSNSILMYFITLYNLNKIFSG